MTLEALVKNYESKIAVVEEEVEGLAKALDHVRAVSVVWRHLDEVQRRVLVPDLDEAKRLLHHGEYGAAIERLADACAQAVREYVATTLGVTVAASICPHYEDVKVLEELLARYASWQRRIVAALLGKSDIIELLGRASVLSQHRARLDELMAAIDEVASVFDENGICERTVFERRIAEKIEVVARESDVDDAVEDMIVYLARLRDAARLIERIRSEVESVREAAKTCSGEVCNSIVKGFQQIASRVNRVGELVSNAPSIAALVEEASSIIHDVYSSLSGMRRSLEKLAIRLSMEQGIRPPQDLSQTLRFIQQQVGEGILSQVEVDVLLYTAAHGHVGLVELLKRLEYPAEDVLKALARLCSKEVMECSVSVT